MSIPSKNESPVLDSEIESWMNVLKEKYGASRSKHFEKEAPIIRVFLADLKKEIEHKEGLISKIICPWEVGGTGIIFKVAQRNMPNEELILKFSRPLISGDELTIVENELKILPKMNHTNIVRVFDVGSMSFKVDGQEHSVCFIVEPFIPGVLKLSDYCLKLFDKEKHLTEQMLDDSLQKLCELLEQWVDALIYIHKQGYVYLDVKPSNVLVDKDGHVIVIDFGSVKEYDPGGSGSVYVYFTERYADLRLKKSASSSTSTDRIKKSISVSDILFEYDYYALGKSIIELLNDALRNYEHDLPERPLFRSLHFIATRLLNGLNDQEQIAPDTHHVGEIFPGLIKSDYTAICYKSGLPLEDKNVMKHLEGKNSRTALEDLSIDLKKETGIWNPEIAVPELGSYSKDVLRIVFDTYTVLTPRLKELMSHPLFARLKQISQLGLISLVYPTADHTRFDHVLGAYTYTSKYVKSLIHDPQNPVFRNLVNENDIKAVLLAALLHDIGQYPLAHDLGEVHPQIFGHLKISAELLESEKKNKKGKTLKEMITDSKEGWGVSIDCLKQILGAQSVQAKLTKLIQTPSVQDFKADLLSSLIDGPIDADKADYILRDSVECRVPYGQQLDIDRLLRVLTVVLIPVQNRSEHKVTIGVYEKGMASSDSFGLARYLLFSAVYWHHTSRIAKSMLQYGTAMILPREVFGTEGEERIKQLHEKLLQFIIELTPPFEEPTRKTAQIEKPEDKISMGVAPPTDVFEELAKKRPIAPQLALAEEWYPGISLTDWLMLRWIKTLGEPSKGSTLIDNILKRNLYKRAFTLQRIEGNKSLLSDIDRLSWPQKVRLCEVMQQSILSDLKQGQQFETTILPTTVEDIEKLCAQELAVLLDAPDPSITLKGERDLYLVPELERKTYYHEAVAPYKADNLLNCLNQLMSNISPIRILCHPTLLPWIRTYEKPERIRNILEFAVKQVQR